MTRFRARPSALFGLATATVLAVLAPGGPADAAERPVCAGSTTSPPVLILHDLAGTPGTVAPLAERIEATGRCTRTVAWGQAHLGDHARPCAGDAGPDADFDAAGSLLALRAIQVAPEPLPVRRLLSVGSLWDGTNLAGLGTLEQLSRDGGTYDLVLPVEKLLLDVACASCREFIHGSDFLRGLQAAGLRPVGVQQIDIVSQSDGVVVPWTSGQRAGVSTLVVQHSDPAHRVGHFDLPHDRVVQDLVVSVLR